MRTSIRWRLTAWYTSALALTLLVLGTAVFFLMQAALVDSLDDVIRDRAAAAAGRVHRAGGRPELSEADRNELKGGESVEGVLLLDHAGQLLENHGLNPDLFLRSSAVESALRGRPDEGPSLRGDAWRVAACPVRVSGRSIGVVVLAHDLGELHGVMDRLSLVLFALLPLALLIAGGGGFTLAGRALRPVDEITRAASAISERDLSQRLPVRTQDELGRLASTFNGLIDRLALALDRQKRFTADASHELRTPLAVIRSLTTQKLMRGRTPEEYERALRQIDDASSYMTRLVMHLLALARADAGQIELERERVDLTELLQHAAAQVTEASGRTVRIQGENPVLISGDAVQLTSLFLNLLENATRHTPADGDVTVSIRTAGNVAEVVVQDTGIGIPEEHVSHIFERFYRVDPSRGRTQGGAGLGLAIGKWIAESHGGSIRAESQLGLGTRVTVTLPVAIEELAL